MVKVKKKSKGSLTNQEKSPAAQAEEAPADASALVERKKKKKRKVATEEASQGALAAEVAQLVQELGAEAEEAGESWATQEAATMAPKRSKRSSKVKEGQNPADEAAEFSDSSEEEELRLAKKAKTRKEVDSSAGSSTKPGELRNKNADAVPRSADAKPKDELKVYLGNLPWAADEAVLKADFGKFGEITRIRLPLNEHGKRDGTGYIYYESKETVEKVLLLDNIEYKGRSIKVKRRSPRRRSGRRQQHLRQQEAATLGSKWGIE